MREAAADIRPELGPEVANETSADCTRLTQHDLLPRSCGGRQPDVLNGIARDRSNVAPPREPDVAVRMRGEHRELRGVCGPATQTVAVTFEIPWVLTPQRPERRFNAIRDRDRGVTRG